MEGKLPSAVVWRKDKLGFVTPQQAWKKQLAATLQENIRQMKIPELFDRQFVVKMSQQNISDSSHLSEFWRFYSILKWMEVFQVKLVE